MNKNKNILIIFFLIFLFVFTQSVFAKGIIEEREREAEGLQARPQERVLEREHEFAEMRPEIADRTELTVVFSRHDIELDFRKSYFASEAQIFTGIYEGLFSYNPITLEPVLAVAERWSLSEDKTEWTFTIRRNARYWNGDPVRAEDFRAAWISLLEPERNSPYSSLFDVIEGARDFRNGVTRDPNKVGITARGDRTLVVKLNAPAAFFPAMLCHHSFSPIHPSMLKKTDWNPDGKKTWEPPMSNGAFRITTMTEEKMELVKNNHYWDNRVVLNSITIRFAKDGDEAASLWNSGEARWIAGDVNLDALTDRSGIQVNVMFATHYYFIRSAEKPFDDFRIRRAMTLALPWEEIRSNYYSPAETLIFPISGYPEVKGITEQDIDEAKKLLEEAGYPNGEGIPEIIIRLTPGQDAARVGSIMAVTWKEELGLKVRVEVIPFNRYFNSLKEEGYHIGLTTWIGDFADPYTFLQMWVKDSNLNDARFNDPDYEELISRSMMEEGDTRFQTLADAETLLLQRGAVLPIYYNFAVNIVDTNELDGWYPNVMDIHPFKYMSFKGFRPLPGVAMAE